MDRKMKTKHNTGRPRFGALVALIVGLSGSMVACRNDALKDLNAEDSQVFITNFDQSVNFGQYKTFSLPDSVIVQSNDRTQTSATAIEQQFLARVAEALTSRGYMRAPQGQRPDLGAAVIRVNDIYTGVTSTPYSSYLSNYWYGSYGGYGGYSPYYPSYYSFYQVSDQYWNVQLVDLKNSTVADSTTTGTGTTGQNQLNVVYDAQIRGSGIFDAASVDRVVAAIFSQSAYLQTSR